MQSCYSHVSDTCVAGLRWWRLCRPALSQWPVAALTLAMSQLQLWSASRWRPAWVAPFLTALQRMYGNYHMPAHGLVQWPTHMKRGLWHIILSMVGLFHHGYVTIIPMVLIVHDLLTSTQDLRVMAHMTLRLMRPTLMALLHGRYAWAEGLVRIYVARYRSVWPELQHWDMDLTPEELNPGRPWSVSGGSEPNSSDTDDGTWEEDEQALATPMNLSGAPPQAYGGA